MYLIIHQLRGIVRGIITRLSKQEWAVDGTFNVIDFMFCVSEWVCRFFHYLRAMKHWWVWGQSLIIVYSHSTEMT